MKALLRVLAGEAVWPPPVWLMRQAGRYLPEYREVRAKAPDFVALCTTPDLAAEVTLQPLRRYGMDAAILFSDILMLPWALGQNLRFAQGEGPLLDPVRDTEALSRLDTAMVEQRVAPILETVERVAAACAPATLIGFAGSPFTVACYMVEGHGGDFTEARKIAHRDPAFFARLIDLLVDSTVVYLSAQIRSGAETVMLFDSWAGLLPPHLFRRYVIEPTARIVRQLAGLHPETPVIGFPRLAGSLLPEYAQVTGVGCVGMDTASDPAWVCGSIGAATAVQGNLDPLALIAGGPALEEATQAILSKTRGRPHIFNLGHGILPETPPEHVNDLLAQIRSG